MSEQEQEREQAAAIDDLEVPTDQADAVRGGRDGNEDEDLDDLEIQR